ncbi:leucine-rich repeat protein [Treponema phagedenis]|nr:leucine-rich repeat protein [Treponema phagedenis]QEK05619.1 leucine-rich repeat protein [Treponema phagedenis]
MPTNPETGNVTALTKTSIEADKGEKWATVKTKLPTLTFKDNYELDKWVLSGSNDAIADSYAFNGEEILYAVSKAKGTPPPAPGKITIAVKGDPNVTALTKTSIEADKGEKWATVKTKLPTLGFQENYELDKWVLSGSSDAIVDSYAFNGEEILYAVSKAKGTPPPPAPDKITIAVKGDPNVTALTKTSIEADKGEKWATVKTKLPTLTFKDNYELDKWVLSGSSDAIADSYAFNGGETIFAVAKRSQVTVTIAGNANVNLPANKTVMVDKGSTWSELKEKTEIKDVQFADYYELKAWHLTDANGKKLEEYTEPFIADTIVYAVAQSKFTTDGNGTITGYRGEPPVSLVFPKEIDGKLVTKIGKDAFSGRENIKKIDFTNCQNLKEIGENAFKGCIRIMEELVLPQQLKTIGKKAFYDCQNITNIDFTSCQKLTDIEMSAFSGCIKIGKDIPEPLVLPKQLKTIGEFAFSRCVMAMFKLPAGIETIGDGAFGYTTDDRTLCFKIFIPKGATAIERKLHDASYPTWKTGRIEYYTP